MLFYWDRQAIALPLPAGLDPFQQQLQSRPLHLARSYLAPVADEAPRLQALTPDAKTGAVEIQNLHLSGSPRYEHKQIPAQWVRLQSLSRQCMQPRKGLAHIARMSVQMDADLSFRKEHQPRTKCSSTPPPSSSRTSKRERPEPSAPRSMNSPEDLSTRSVFVGLRSTPCS